LAIIVRTIAQGERRRWARPKVLRALLWCFVVSLSVIRNKAVVASVSVSGARQCRRPSPTYAQRVAISRRPAISAGAPFAAQGCGQDCRPRTLRKTEANVRTVDWSVADHVTGALAGDAASMLRLGGFQS